jgi:hypothetical protein
MYRQEIRLQVQANRFKEFSDSFDQLNKLMRSHGLVTGTLWSVAIGQSNLVKLTFDYESLAQFEVENDRFLTDTEMSGMWQEATEFLDGYPVDEIWRSGVKTG